jgi:hypothetical protein
MRSKGLAHEQFVVFLRSLVSTITATSALEYRDWRVLFAHIFLKRTAQHPFVILANGGRWTFISRHIPDVVFLQSQFDTLYQTLNKLLPSTQSGPIFDYLMSWTWVVPRYYECTEKTYVILPSTESIDHRVTGFANLVTTIYPNEVHRIMFNAKHHDI